MTHTVGRLAWWRLLLWARLRWLTRRDPIARAILDRRWLELDLLADTVWKENRS